MAETNRGSLKITATGDISAKADNHGMQISANKYGAHAQIAPDEKLAEIFATLDVHAKAPRAWWRRIFFALFGGTDTYRINPDEQLIKSKQPDKK